MAVAQAAFAARQPDDFFTVGEHFGFFFTRFLIQGDGTQRHVDNDVFTIAAGLVVIAAAFAVFRQDVFVVPQVQQRPQVAVAA